MANVVELKSVEKVYSGVVDTQVLFDINLSFKEGSFNSIVGESGSGKSTLLNIIGTLDKPTRGEVFIDGDRINDLNKDKLAEIRNQTIGFVFQFHYLLPEFTAMENVLMPYSIGKKGTAKSIAQRANELFDLLGMAKIKNNMANKMSGGQQQRTAIARALINNPKVIVADEPTGNLDSENTKTIYKIFREINQQFGTTFLIVTHDRRIAEEADRIVEIKDGRITADVNK
jgi:lipoprotein-releasing system ATP-binding protein